MVTTHVSQRVHGQFLATGSQPLAASGINTMTTNVPDSLSYSSLRLRTDVEMYVIAGGGTTDIDLSFAYESIMVVGALVTVAGATTVTPTPLTEEDIIPFVGQLGSWGQWDYLYPDIQFVNTLIPQLAVVTWRKTGDAVDTQFRRRSDHLLGMDLWMPWEVQDGSGLINTTDAGGNSYNLGVRFAQSWWWEYRT